MIILNLRRLKIVTEYGFNCKSVCLMLVISASLNLKAKMHKGHKSMKVKDIIKTNNKDEFSSAAKLFQNVTLRLR